MLLCNNDNYCFGLFLASGGDGLLAVLLRRHAQVLRLQGHGSEAGVQTTNEMDAFGWKGIQYHFRTLKSEFLAYSKT